MRIRHSSPLFGLLVAAACGGEVTRDAPDAGDPDVDAEPVDVPVLTRPSKSATIAITGDDRFVIMVNPEADSIAIFDTASNTRTALVATGPAPSAVVIHPDNTTVFVAHRGDATVVKVSNLDTATPDVSDPLAVGSEPTGLALSPTGATLYVAEWAEGRIAVIDTATLTETAAIDAPKNPRGVAVTNDGDQDDGDELIIVPEFYGEPTGTEGTDRSRNGRVRIYGAADLLPQDPITLAPIDSGFAPAGAADPTTVFTSPNQLWTAAIVGSKVYLPSVSASPAPPISFTANVQPVVYVGDLDSRTEDRGPGGTVNLAALVRDQIPSSEPRFFLADIVDLAFVGDQVMYAVSRGADVLQRVLLDPTAGPTLGSTQNFQIDLNLVPAGSTKRCQTPSGLVIGHANNTAYVNCWATRQLGVVDLSLQALVATVEGAPVNVDEAAAQDGLHFYFTARGRWAKGGWSDCGSCHPDGLSDNMTWIFGAGPRQTTSMDGTFSHFAGEPQKQRLLNWTAIFDELHDFERNTREVSAGLGAVTTSASNQCGTLDAETPVALAGGLQRPVRGDQVCTTDWDKIEAFSKTIRPPLALRKLDPASVERGRVLFGEGGQAAACVRCHGGDGWTASRLYFTPEAAGNTALTSAGFVAPDAWPTSGTFRWNFHTVQIANQPQTDVFGAGEPEATLASVPPAQVACGLRNVGTFGVFGDAAATAALEVKNFAVNGGPGGRAQGRLGYNVPSLYGLALGAPYLHHGGPASLAELFDEPAWATHATAGNPNWLQGTADEVAQRKADLISFLLSIDAAEPEQDLPTALPAGPFDGCDL